MPSGTKTTRPIAKWHYARSPQITHLVLKLAAKHGLSASAGAGGVAALDHEISDDAVTLRQYGV